MTPQASDCSVAVATPRQRFRKKPDVIEAMQWDGTAEAATPIINWVLSSGGTATYDCTDPVRCGQHSGRSPHYIAIRTLDGPMIAYPGDWVVEETRGEFYPVKPGLFTEAYEAVEPPPETQSDHGPCIKEMLAEVVQANLERAAKL